MIGRLTGRIDTLGEDWAILDVGGVGYHVTCSARTLRGLGGAGGDVRMFIETFVRDDRIMLYGFADEGERNCFRVLTSVQGVGARVALAILSALSAGELVEAVLAQDKAAVSRANGVGQRLAQRVVTELRDRVADIGPGTPLHPSVEETGPDADAVLALVNLGYTRSEAFRAVAAARGRLGGDADMAALVRASLQELAR